MIAIYKDTNTINEDSDNLAINALEQLVKDTNGEVSIEITSVLNTELSKDPEKNKDRIKKAEEYIYTYEVAVLGESQLGSSVVGSDRDNIEYGDILSIIFGDKPRANYKSNDRRDALHIHTAIRGGGRYFITYDKKLLRKSMEIEERFHSVIICTPERCLELVLERIKVLKQAGYWKV